jgi:hypothetical protein
MPIDQNTAIALLQTAATTLINAKTTAASQHAQLGNEIRAADVAMQDMTSAITNVSGASPAQMVDATAASVRAAAVGLQAASTLLNAAIPPEPNEGKSLDEWKECRATIDRCDKLLVDLRKTGFGFVTAVVGASVYVFGRTDHSGNDAKSLLVCMLVMLIIVLYLVDLAHQTLLSVAVERAKVLEREPELNFTLTQNISKEFAASLAIGLGCALYSLVLFATCAIFWASIPLPAEDLFSAPRANIYGAFAVGLFVILASPLVSPQRWRWLPLAVVPFAAAGLFAYLHGFWRIP